MGGSDELTVHRPVKSSNQRLRERIDLAREERGMSPPKEESVNAARGAEKQVAEKMNEADEIC